LEWVGVAGEPLDRSSVSFACLLFPWGQWEAVEVEGQKEEAVAEMEKGERRSRCQQESFQGVEEEGSPLLLEGHPPGSLEPPFLCR
jgi:hypothetical protein